MGIIGDLGIASHPENPHINYSFDIFIASNVSALNAPIRQIPMSQNLQRPIPNLEDEPDWMKRSTVCPLEAGTAIIRDPRAWHGGTPNLSNEMRCLVNMEYYAYWYR